MSDREREPVRPLVRPERLAFVDVLERAGIAALVLDAGGTIAWCNPRLAQLLGRPGEEVVGADVCAFVAPDRREATRQLLDGLADRASDSFEHEVEVERAGGGRLVLRWTATLLRDAGRVTGIACLVEDVTARGLAAQADRLARAALDASGTAVAIADEQRRLVYANAAMLRLWGFTREEEVLGRSLADFWTDPAVALAAATAVARHGHWRGELFARRADGSEAIYRVYSSLFTDAETGTVRSIATFEDVTELRATEERLGWIQRLARIGDWSLDVSTRLLTCGDATYDLLGVSRERLSLTRDEFLALVHPDDRATVHAAFFRAIRSAERLGIAFRLRGPGGDDRVVRAEARLIHDAAGRPLQLRGVFQLLDEPRHEERAGDGEQDPRGS